MKTNPLNDGQVQEEDAAEGEPAQGVQNVQALAVGGRPAEAVGEVMSACARILSAENELYN